MACAVEVARRSDRINASRLRRSFPPAAAGEHLVGDFDAPTWLRMRPVNTKLGGLLHEYVQVP
jgi:hypothetical protein